MSPSSGQTELISTTVSSGFFTLTKSNTASDCVIESYSLFSDSSATISLSNPKIIQDTSVSAVSNNYPIKIDRGSALAPTNVYLKATTVGGKTAIKPLMIEVCGTETLTLASSSTYKVTRAPSSGSPYVISATLSSSWFSLSPSVSSSECVVSSYGLYSDAAATTSWSNSAIYQDTTVAAVSNNYNIKIN
jgi:hypothetical protein